MPLRSQTARSGVETERYKGFEPGNDHDIVTPEGNRRNQRQALVAAGLMGTAVKAEVTPFRSLSAKMAGLVQPAG
jgi:hypothetical protein